jgi:peptidyl-prolyl cis-trans isomerase C
MRSAYRFGWAAAAVTLLPLAAPAQQPATTAPGTTSVSSPAPTPRPTGNAAVVNGQPITEAALQRSLKRFPPEKRAEFRKETLSALIDNVLVDQYLRQYNLNVEQKEIDAGVAQIYDEIKKDGQTIEKVMQDLFLTEDELRTQLTEMLRWDKYTAAMATDKALRELFDGNKELFDGSMVHARHILLKHGPGKTAEQLKPELLLIKKQIEDEVVAEMAKITPPPADNLAREEARIKLLDIAFAKKAMEKSACPTKTQGGDLPWFTQLGSMVDPFAKAAFALKPYQISDVVVTEVGCHLIMVMERKPGSDVKFEDAKAMVKEEYCVRLKDTFTSRLRPTAKITIVDPQKP